MILNKQAGCYTPESSVEHPEPVENLAEEFARAGADITQTFTYYNLDIGTPEGCNLTVGIIFLKIIGENVFHFSVLKSTKPVVTLQTDVRRNGEQ